MALPINCGQTVFEIWLIDYSNKKAWEISWIEKKNGHVIFQSFSDRIVLYMVATILEAELKKKKQKKNSVFTSILNIKKRF